MHSSKTEQLLFIWTDPASRRRNVVGCLQKWADRFTFRYTKPVHEESRKRPWLLPSFPEATKVYESRELFPTFERRLPDPSRRDFGQFVRAFGLTPPVEPWELLKVSGGRLATDTFEFALPLTRTGDRIAVDFYVAGWQYHGANLDPHEYQPGTRLRIELEPTNTHDPCAHKILTKSGKLIGYVPAFYAQTLTQLSVPAQAEVVVFDPGAGPKGALYVRLKGSVPPSVPGHQLDECFCT